ncbi:hypothetical protein NE237_012515 [Protea cynaroides]|uniref:Rho GDP-dissociation inhibitor 1 n=1 Tax=Protea cynaroides TaxID=273540 RepID=A0A9Q0GWZ9_9MAGN|nr:hypothetical protein NE237_012515 [Protea cynaroides]
MSAAIGALSGFKAVLFSTAGMEKSNNIHGAKQNEVHEDEVKAEKRRKDHRSDSVCSLENGEDGDDDDDLEDDDESHVGKEGPDPGPQFSLKEQLEKDKDDESLRKWKEQLLGSVDLEAVGEHAEPEVRVLSLTILSPDRPDVVLPIPFIPNSRGFSFSLKDGSRYRLRFSFVVSNNIVSGLKYTNIVWKTGMRVDKRRVMLGTFSPQQEPYTYELEEDTTPSGLFARGSYSARTKLVDDDNKCYLDINYSFEIRREWPTLS